MVDSDRPVEVMCRYRVKQGKEQAFEEFLLRHWPALNEAGLTTDEPARLLRGSDKAGNSAYFETFAWKDPQAVQTAHETPEVMRLWEPMGSLCIDMEFWNVEPVSE